MNQPNLDLVAMYSGLKPQEARELTERIASAVKTAYQDFTVSRAAQQFAKTSQSAERRRLRRSQPAREGEQARGLQSEVDLPK